MDATNTMDQTYTQIALETTGHCLVGTRPDKYRDKFWPCNTSLRGAVDGLEPATQTWLSERTHDSCRKPARMVCHRIAIDTLARDLSTFCWCKVLLSCIADAVEGAQQAYAAAGVLHRDISSSNITIAEDKKTHERRGVLIDWDIPSLSQTHEGEAHPRRIGTWAFTSATLSRTPGRVAHTLWDSTESAFWVLLHHALRYLKHTYAPHPLHHLLTRLFHERPATCVSHKETVIIFCAIRRKHKILPQFRIPGLNDALEDLGGVFDFRYQAEESEVAPPDQGRFPELLRRTALGMEPRCVTPTGLVSPTNDSEPPADPEEWQAATVDTGKTDFYRMPSSAFRY